MINFLKKRQVKKSLLTLLIFFLSFSLFGCSLAKDNKVSVDKDQAYWTKDEVALYLHDYSELPPNFITKKEASALGWKSSEGNLWQVTDKASIGGDVFGNREGLLPKEKGRTYYEADINYQGGFRGAERIVYSNDGLIYYTDDHYKSFTKLY